MGSVIEVTKKFFDEKGIHYEEDKDGNSLRVGIGGLENMDHIMVYLNFDDNNRGVCLRAFNLCKIPEGKVDALYELCSDLNADYRWVKFYVDSNDNTITAEDDAVVSPESAGAELFELLARMTKIVDKAYPDMMKALWA